MTPNDAHFFTTTGGSVGLLLTNGSRVHRLPAQVARMLEWSLAHNQDEVTAEILANIGVTLDPVVDMRPPQAMPIRALSLAVAQKCNLGCTYCYADGGDFGDTPVNMSEHTAITAVSKLFSEVSEGEKVTLAFMGGEPLLNRGVIRAATIAAKKQAEAKNVEIGFSITTNGTLLTLDDGVFFEEHGFSVTVSIDGIGDNHDVQRPFKGGRGSYGRIIERVQRLLAMQNKMQIGARVTVTPKNLALADTLDDLFNLGFYNVGFSPMLSSPTGNGEMATQDLDGFLKQMIACGRECESRLIAGAHYPFTNFLTALANIDRGTHMPYSCGAGGSYFGVAADGAISACHRFVGDPRRQMGDLEHGIDRNQQKVWLKERHVDRQEPCRSCWARYLCGGGCQHEVINRGRVACDYIRGWLDYCLGAYVRLKLEQPHLFNLPQVHAEQRASAFRQTLIPLLSLGQ